MLLEGFEAVDWFLNYVMQIMTMHKKDNDCLGCHLNNVKCN